MKVKIVHLADDPGFETYIDDQFVGSVDPIFGARSCTRDALEIILEIAEVFNIDVWQRTEGHEGLV